MRRRTLLAVVGSSFAGVAGCSSSGSDDTTTTPSMDESPTDEDDTATPNDDETTSHDDIDNSDPSPTDDEPEQLIRVELRQVEYVARSYEAWPRGAIHDLDAIVPEDEIPDTLHDALLEAREDGFESDSAPGELLAALDEFRSSRSGSLQPYVVLDGTTYEFDPELPTFVAELEEENLEEYDEDRVFWDDDRREIEDEEVQEFVLRLISRGTHIPRAEYRRFVPPDAVEAFLEECDYIEDDRGVSRIETTVDNEDPPYTIELSELTEADIWGSPIIEETDIDDETLAFLNRVLESEHRAPAQTSADRTRYYTDDVPESYFDVVGEYDSTVFRLDDTEYNIYVGEPTYERIPVSVTVEEHDERDRAFTFIVTPSPESVEEDVKGSYTFSSSGGLPSVLWILHEGERYLLDSHRYERDRWRDADDDSDLDRRASNEVLETVGTQTEISATYTVPDELPDGTYVSRGTFRLSWSVPDQVQGERGSYPFELVITIESS